MQLGVAELCRLLRYPCRIDQELSHEVQVSSRRLFDGLDDINALPGARGERGSHGIEEPRRIHHDRDRIVAAFAAYFDCRLQPLASEQCRSPDLALLPAAPGYFLLAWCECHVLQFAFKH